MTTASASVKKSAPGASGFVPSRHSQSSEAEAKADCETSGVMLEAFDLTIHLPDGSTTVTSVDPSKPMMDLLIKICAQLKLNPADHTLQIFPPDSSSWPVSYKANQTFASVGMNNVVKLILKRTERVEDKQNSQRPFEITQRVIVSLPSNQRFVMRVRPDISMSELFKAAVEHKELDPHRYSLCHPTNPEIVLNMDYPLDFYGISEIYLAYANVGRVNGSPNLNSQPRNSGSSKNELPTAPLSGTMSRQYETASRTRNSFANGYTMQRTTSDALSKSSEFLPGTKHEKKKGLFSFFRRKKNGKSSLGGSMQNLHQMDGTSTLSLPKQDQDYPAMSELQLHRQSLPSSNAKANLTRGISTEAITTCHLSIAPDVIAPAPKKRPAPQPPAYLLPLQTETGSGRLVRPAPRLPGVPRTPLSHDEVQASNSLVLGSPEAVLKPPEGDKSAADEAVKHENEGKHSPASSQSSGFGEMSPSPSEDYKRPNLNGPHSVATTTTTTTTASAGLTVDSVASGPQPAPRTKRQAPPPPASLQPVVMVSASALISQSDTGPMVCNSSINNGSLTNVNHLRNLSEENNSHLTKVVEEADDENGISATNTDAYSGKNTKNGIEDGCVEVLPPSETGVAEILNRINTQQPITAENDCSDYEPVEPKVVDDDDDDEEEEDNDDDDDDDDDGDTDAAAEEGEDYFCEMDAGYDGEIDFENVDIVFVAPEALQPHRVSMKSQGDLVPDCATDGQSASVVAHSQRGVQIVSTSSGGQVSSCYQTSLVSDEAASTDNDEIGSLPSQKSENCALKNETRNRSTDDCSAGLSLSNHVHSHGSADHNKSVIENLSTDVNKTYVGFPNNDLTHSADDTSQHLYVGLDLDGSELAQRADNVGLCREPQTVIIDRSELLSAGSLASAHESNDDYRKTLLEPDHVQGRDLNSWKTCSAEDPFNAETPSTISDETRKKLSDDSFLIDRSLCRRFYPSAAHSPVESDGLDGELITSVTSERADGSSIRGYTTNEEEEGQDFIEETSQLPANSTIRSLRELKSRPEATKKSLYRLVNNSNSSPSVSNETNANDVSDICKNGGQAERKKIKSPEPQSPVESFTVELQKHLSQWQRQHSRNSNEPPTKSDVNSRDKLTMDGSILPLDGSKLDLKRDSRTLPNTNNHNNSGFGSTNVTNGSSSVSGTELGRKVSTGLSTGAKQFDRSEVVFTMDQLLAARSGLKKTATSEKSDEFQSERSVQKPTAPVSDRNSSKSVNRMNSFAEIPPSASSASKSPPSSFQNTVAPEPATRQRLPVSTTNQKEKRSEQTQSVAGKTFSRAPEPVVDLHDQLLTAIRNAGGRPAKNRSAVQ